MSSAVTSYSLNFVERHPAREASDNDGDGHSGASDHCFAVHDAIAVPILAPAIAVQPEDRWELVAGGRFALSLAYPQRVRVK